MGARFAPPFAIIYLYMLEREIIAKLNGILFYKRYIDDVIIFFDENIINPDTILENFNKLDRNIVFTMEVPKMVNILHSLI